MHLFNSRKARSRRVANEPDAGRAFVQDFRSGLGPISDGDVDALGAEFVFGVTSNDAVAELARDELYAGEEGGLVFDLEDEDLSDCTAFAWTVGV